MIGQNLTGSPLLAFLLGPERRRLREEFGVVLRVVAVAEYGPAGSDRMLLLPPPPPPPPRDEDDDDYLYYGGDAPAGEPAVLHDAAEVARRWAAGDTVRFDMAGFSERVLGEGAAHSVVLECSGTMQQARPPPEQQGAHPRPSLASAGIQPKGGPIGNRVNRALPPPPLLPSLGCNPTSLEPPAPRPPAPRPAPAGPLAPCPPSPAPLCGLRAVGADGAGAGALGHSGGGAGGVGAAGDPRGDGRRGGPRGASARALAEDGRGARCATRFARSRALVGLCVSCGAVRAACGAVRALWSSECEMARCVR